MAIGAIGRKVGMTRTFGPDGAAIPVTVVQVGENRVSQVRRMDRDGYTAIQVTTGERVLARTPKPLRGHYAAAGIAPGVVTREFRTDGSNDIPALGDAIAVTQFLVGQFLDVRGLSKGRGFSGTIRRHNFRGQDSTHGNSLSHRAPGSIGQCQTPGRVLRGKKMAGQLGNRNCCQQNVEVINVDVSRGVLLLRGCLPGAAGGVLLLRPAVKAGPTNTQSS